MNSSTCAQGAKEDVAGRRRLAEQAVAQNQTLARHSMAIKQGESEQICGVACVNSLRCQSHGIVLVRAANSVWYFH